SAIRPRWKSMEIIIRLCFAYLDAFTGQLKSLQSKLFRKNMCNFEKTPVFENDKYPFTLDTHTKSHCLIPQPSVYKSPYFRRDSNDSTTS
ncbi:17581_t:CDS:2, partial [Racocetra persica]